MKKRILVVDDEEPIQELIKVYLSPLKAEIYPAFTGEASWHRWHRNDKAPAKD